jgi:hypothetical protein
MVIVAEKHLPHVNKMPVLNIIIIITTVTAIGSSPGGSGTR